MQEQAEIIGILEKCLTLFRDVRKGWTIHPNDDECFGLENQIAELLRVNRKLPRMIIPPPPPIKTIRCVKECGNTQPSQTEPYFCLNCGSGIIFEPLYKESDLI